MNKYNIAKKGKDFEIQQFPRSNFDFYKNIDIQYNIINKETLISSMGSCFARQVSGKLIENNYNYLQVNDECEWGGWEFSANGENVFNIPCIKQIFQYSFEEFDPIVRGWPKNENVIDPFRKNIMYTNEEKDRLFNRHRKNSKYVLENAEVIILTLGMTEIGRDKRDKATFFRVVPKKLYDPEIHEFHIMTAEECLNDLNEIKRLINLYNPSCKLIISISPIPLYATFRKDADPISANYNSKATLKVAVDQFIRENENVYYFPSFEYAILENIKNFFQDDNRHVKPGSIKKIFKLFENLFLENDNITQE